MGKYDYDEKKHSDPLMTFDLNSFYFVTHEGKVLIFKKTQKGKHKKGELKK